MIGDGSVVQAGLNITPDHATLDHSNPGSLPDRINRAWSRPMNQTFVLV